MAVVTGPLQGVGSTGTTRTRGRKEEGQMNGFFKAIALAGAVGISAMSCSTAPETVGSNAEPIISLGLDIEVTPNGPWGGSETTVATVKALNGPERLFIGYNGAPRPQSGRCPGPPVGTGSFGCGVVGWSYSDNEDQYAAGTWFNNWETPAGGPSAPTPPYFGPA